MTLKLITEKQGNMVLLWILVVNELRILRDMV